MENIKSKPFDAILDDIWCGETVPDTPGWPQDLMGFICCSLEANNNNKLNIWVRRSALDKVAKYSIIVESKVDDYPMSSAEFTPQEFICWYHDMRSAKAHCEKALSYDEPDDSKWIVSDTCCDIYSTHGIISGNDSTLILIEQHMGLVCHLAPQLIPTFDVPDRVKKSTLLLWILAEEAGRGKNTFGIKVFKPNRKEPMLTLTSTIKNSTVRGLKLNIAQFNCWIDNLEDHVLHGYDVEKTYSEEMFWNVFRSCEHTITTKGKINNKEFVLCLSNEGAKFITKAAPRINKRIECFRNN